MPKRSSAQRLFAKTTYSSASWEDTDSVGPFHLFPSTLLQEDVDVAGCVHSGSLFKEQHGCVLFPFLLLPWAPSA